MQSDLRHLILISLIIFIGCKEQFTPNTDPDFQVPAVVPTDNEKYLNKDSDYIFDQDQLHTFQLKIPGSALNELDKDPSAEKYVEGMLIFESDTLSPVGIRYKGSIGAWVGCISGDNVFEPSGFKTCTKLSMKIDIDKYQKFFKLKKLQFHSQNQDASQMRERLGYWLFREMGVPAPRSVHAKLIINGQYKGLFALTEQVDKRFIKENFDDNKGNLYKEVWPLKRGGLLPSDASYIEALKTNKDRPSIELFKVFSQSLADSELPETRDLVEQYMDIDEIMTYIAVDRTIRHDDGPFHWYCGPQGCTNHNYYWYEEPSRQKLHLIAWDMNDAFENIIHDYNPITPIKDEWGEYSNECHSFQYRYARQWSAQCDKLTATWASYTDEYAQKKSKFINGPLSAERVNPLLDKWQEQIKNATIEAKSFHEDAPSIRRWEAAIVELKEQLDYARKH
jgi:spore coat protein CotH